MKDRINKWKSSQIYSISLKITYDRKNMKEYKGNIIKLLLFTEERLFPKMIRYLSIFSKMFVICFKRKWINIGVTSKPIVLSGEVLYKGYCLDPIHTAKAGLKLPCVIFLVSYMLHAILITNFDWQWCNTGSSIVLGSFGLFTSKESWVLPS